MKKWICPICNKEIKKSEWIVNGRQFSWLSYERPIHITCLGKPIKQ